MAKDLIGADTILAEAEAIKSLARLICNEYQSTDLDRAQVQELYNAIYGLRDLIAVHAEHAQALEEAS